MSLRDTILNGTTRLSEAVLNKQNGEPDVQSRSNTGQYAHYSIKGDIHRIGPNQGDLEHYRDQYELCPLVRVSINTFADDVTAPGHRVEAADDDLQQELENWLSNCAIVGGESHRDFSEILIGTIIQEQIRGTAMAEIVRQKEDEDAIWGFRIVNPSTVEAYTYDSQAILIRPSDTNVNGVKTTRRGEAAAYGQWGDGALAGPFNRETVYLSQNDIIKLVKDPDTSEIFGNSSIAPVSSEIDELYQMLDDVSEAVHSKGYPLWVFGLGEPNGDAENPRAGIWPEEEMKNYRNEHKEGNWSTNQKDFVPGDVSVDRIEGEVPEVRELLDWYVEEIVSAMPVPKYKLGFAGDINRDITSEQSPQYERRVRAKRRRLQNTFTPILQEKAEEFGYNEDVVSTVQLKIEEDQEENPLKRDDFSADDFATFAKGLQDASGGDATEIVEPDEMRQMIGLPDREDSESENMSQLDHECGPDCDHSHEYDDEVQAQFEEMYGEPLTPDSVDDGDDVEINTSPDTDEQ